MKKNDGKHVPHASRGTERPTGEQGAIELLGETLDLYDHATKLFELPGLLQQRFFLLFATGPQSSDFRLQFGARRSALRTVIAFLGADGAGADPMVNLAHIGETFRLDIEFGVIVIEIFGDLDRRRRIAELT